MQNDVQRDLNSVTDPKASFLTDKFLELQKKVNFFLISYANA